MMPPSRSWRGRKMTNSERSSSFLIKRLLRMVTHHLMCLLRKVHVLHLNMHLHQPQHLQTQVHWLLHVLVQYGEKLCQHVSKVDQLCFVTTSKFTVIFACLGSKLNTQTMRNWLKFLRKLMTGLMRGPLSEKRGCGWRSWRWRKEEWKERTDTKKELFLCSQRY